MAYLNINCYERGICFICHQKIDDKEAFCHLECAYALEVDKKKRKENDKQANRNN